MIEESEIGVIIWAKVEEKLYNLMEMVKELHGEKKVKKWNLI